MSVSRESAYLVELGLERRQGERKIFKRSGHLMPLGLQPHHVRIQDLGLDGLDVISPLNLGTGLNCGLRFHLPMGTGSNDEIWAQVRVSHSVLSGRQGGFVVCLRFAEIADDSLRAIRHYLAG